MAPKNKQQQKSEIERPCADCTHVHEGKCTEDGCKCEVSRVAEVPVASEAPADRITAEIDLGVQQVAGEVAMAPKPVSQDRQQANGLGGLSDNQRGAPAPNTFAAIPLQERIANLLEDYAIENRIPVGCELVIAGKCFAWNGEKMIESAPAAAPSEAPKPAALALSEDDKAKLREFFAEQEVKELPDGSVILPVRIDADQVEILKAWAEGSQEPWVTYLQRTVEMGLNAVVNGGTVAGYEPAVK